MTERKPNARTDVETRQTVLTPMEDKVVRMRRGLTAPDDLVLERLGQNSPELAAKLAAIEQQAIATVGARDSAAKRKIVSALRKKTIKLDR